MAVTVVGAAGVQTGSTTVTATLNASWQPGDLGVLIVANGHPDTVVPTVAGVGGEWTYAGSDAGSSGSYAGGGGPRRITFYTRALTLGDGAPTVSQPTDSGVTMAAAVLVLRKASTEAWAVRSPVFGEDISSGTGFSATTAATPSQMVAGACVVGAIATTGGSATNTAEAITTPGVTLGALTEYTDGGGTAGGFGVSLAVLQAMVTAGPATGPPVVSSTVSTSVAGEAGVLVVLATTGTVTAVQDSVGDPLRVNEFGNAGAETAATTGWTVMQSAGTTVFDTVDVVEEGIGNAPGGASGRRAFRLTGASTNTTVLGMSQPLTYAKPAGTVVTVSFDLFLPTGTAVDEVKVGWVNGSATVYSTSTLTPVAGWKRYSVTHTVPAGQTLATTQVYTNDVATARGADTIYFDNLMFEQAATVGTYFDGYTTSAGYVANWASTVLGPFGESALRLARTPPRVGVTLSGFASDQPTTVYRVHPDGVAHEVRGGTVMPSGGAAFVWDYEAPTNTQVYYTADDAGTTRTSGSIVTAIIRRNGVLNPALTGGSTGWAAATNGVITAATSVVAATVNDSPVVNGVLRAYYRLQVSAITTGAIASTGITYGSTTVTQVAADPGPWAGSIVWRSNVTDRTCAMVVTFHDAAGATLGSAVTGASVNSAGRWVRAVVAATAPAGTVRAFVRLYATGGAVWAVGNRLEATALLVENNRAATGSYFDGDTPGSGYRWAGTAGASYSEAFAVVPPTPLILTDTRSFLRSPGLPGLDIACRVVRVPQNSRPRETTFLRPIGRTTTVPLAATRTAPQYTLELLTLTAADAAALVEFMDGTPTGYLLFPGTRYHGTYVSLGELQEVPHEKVGPEEVRWAVAAVEVSRPGGGITYDPSSSWASLVGTSSSWQSVLSTYPSWLDVLRGPPSTDA